MPRPVSMSAVSMVGRFGEISRRLSEPCAASARPQIGPASTRVISITRMPSSGRVPARHSGFGASPIRSMEISGSVGTARLCGCASHCAKVRALATTSPAAAAASSNFSAVQPCSASPTALRS